MHYRTSLLPFKRHDLLQIALDMVQHATEGNMQKQQPKPKEEAAPKETLSAANKTVNNGKAKASDFQSLAVRWCRVLDGPHSHWP